MGYRMEDGNLAVEEARGRLALNKKVFKLFLTLSALRAMLAQRLY
jgi:hypothetical protein